jgi:glycosyltransferase involved in cell wall biosynthesis
MIDVSFINRSADVLPLNYVCKIPTYFIAHDIFRPDQMILDNPYLLGVFGISEFHVEQAKSLFPSLAHKVKYVSYGIDMLQYSAGVNVVTPKINHSFIYSSFPNRGLLHLLQIFPKIVAKYPDAVLNVFCNTKMDYVQTVAKAEMDEIDRLLIEQKESVTNHGWVSRRTLDKFLESSHVLLYPCVFVETCCRSLYEAAAAKTLVIANHLGALRDSVGDRGLIIKTDIKDSAWEKECLDLIDVAFDVGLNVANALIKKNYDWVSEKSYDTVCKDFVQKYCS